MNAIVVIGPVDGFSHLGYYAEDSNTFFLIQKFCNKEFADMTAWRMNDARQKGSA